MEVKASKGPRNVAYKQTQSIHLLQTPPHNSASSWFSCPVISSPVISDTLSYEAGISKFTHGLVIGINGSWMVTE